MLERYASINMADCFTPSGRLHTPFRIFLRSSNRRTNQEILDVFSLQHYIPCEPNSQQRQIKLIELDDWLLIADDWNYTLWHLHITRQAIANLALDSDVYHDMVGDSCQSYGFAIYRNGCMVREVQVDSPQYNNQIPKIDNGPRLPVEGDTLLVPDIVSHVDTIAEHIGIRLPRQTDTVMAYCPMPNPP